MSLKSTTTRAVSCSSGCSSLRGYGSYYLSDHKGQRTDFVSSTKSTSITNHKRGGQIKDAVFAFLLSLPPSRQIRGRIAGSSPPSALWFVPCIFIARRFQLFLPSSTRVELRLPTLGAETFFFTLQINSKSRHGGIRTHGPTLAAFEGFH